jgi:hypothetical protein
MFFRGHYELPVIDEWTWQPGWGGDIDGISWSIEYDDETFAEVVDAIKADGNFTLLTDWPEWRVGSYWGFNVLDPMGNTVELYCSPDETPESETWPVD